MKRLFAILILSSASIVMAESYKAPSFKMPSKKPVDAKAQKSAWDDESHFKVEESIEAERDLASSPERDADWAKPSDQEVVAPAAKDEGKIIPWKMIDKN
ncbi:MAG: hypothetical protein COW01_08430 [Bdellovibrionales bacterium CG12_big_fil_rev_8_21_14_0_65_38_15]|nr:MAG: hypothetical protein COW79_15445 [Bdellovibrionales bacterium CG22_combo_CG10-13_8_21_14_all_38_13]PIQ55156.1 MAG: hypothetical protein COW01_08430 [Bdellovibrionales bacterium CG12_big_fil_rev_8_21_14_0_65_38_15]PIR29705.1 MAG: hypothetical protein COV38_09325 [Bdellovibrionales bacterium CG11_big_fil_rev_8_21_14_0_20_38_13]